MWQIIALVAVVLIIALLIYAATRPDTFRIQRSASIHARPEKIFPLIDDFHSWNSWSPWEKMDPLLKRSYSGAVQGQGAVYEWEGNSQVGKGRMEIAGSSPFALVTIKLDFIKPFEARNIAEFTLEATGGSTNVTWAMYGTNPYMMKVMQIFFSMDGMVGKQFEIGLANLKSIAER